MINKFMVFILFFCIFGITKADDFDSPFYPDLQFTENVLVAGSKVPINKTVLLRSVSAIAKENGKCEVTVEYEIYNKGVVAVSQRFFSGIEINGKMDSSRLINGIGANEKKIINNAVWLSPGETTEIRIVLDNFKNVKEVNEDNNSKSIRLLLTGTCNSDSREVTDKKSSKKGLFKRFEFKVQ